MTISAAMFDKLLDSLHETESEYGGHVAAFKAQGMILFNVACIGNQMTAEQEQALEDWRNAAIQRGHDELTKGIK